MLFYHSREDRLARAREQPGRGPETLPDVLRVLCVQGQGRRVGGQPQGLLQPVVDLLQRLQGPVEERAAEAHQGEVGGLVVCFMNVLLFGRRK